jgi:hypothetical protein
VEGVVEADEVRDEGGVALVAVSVEVASGEDDGVEALVFGQETGLDASQPIQLGTVLL